MNAKIAIQPAYSEAVTKALSRKPAFLIDGKWVPPSSTASIDVFDPSTGAKISELGEATASDCDAAVRAARRAFDDGRWSKLPPVVRERLVNRLADLIEANADELAVRAPIDIRQTVRSGHGKREELAHRSRA